MQAFLSVFRQERFTNPFVYGILVESKILPIKICQEEMDAR